MSNRAKYQRIRTMTDLKAERARIRAELKHIEYRLEDQFQDAREILSPGYWMNVVANKFTAGTSSLHLFSKGFNMISSLIRKRKAKKKSKPKKCRKTKDQNRQPEELIIVNSENI